MNVTQLKGLGIMMVNCYMANAGFGFYGLKEREDQNLLEACYKKVCDGKVVDEVIGYYDINRRLKFFQH